MLDDKGTMRSIAVILWKLIAIVTTHNILETGENLCTDICLKVESVNSYHVTCIAYLTYFMKNSTFTWYP